VNARALPGSDDIRVSRTPSIGIETALANVRRFLRSHRSDQDDELGKQCDFEARECPADWLPHESPSVHRAHEYGRLLKGHEDLGTDRGLTRDYIRGTQGEM
jgi:hypothetical protein